MRGLRTIGVKDAADAEGGPKVTVEDREPDVALDDEEARRALQPHHVAAGVQHHERRRGRRAHPDLGEVLPAPLREPRNHWRGHGPAVAPCPVRRAGATGGRRLRDPRRPTLVSLQTVPDQLGRGGVRREGVTVDHAEVRGRRGCGALVRDGKAAAEDILVGVCGRSSECTRGARAGYSVLHGLGAQRGGIGSGNIEQMDRGSGVFLPSPASVSTCRGVPHRLKWQK